MSERVFALGYLPGMEDKVAVALGYGSIYNHGDPANVRHAPDADVSAMMFVAARAISAGDELTINYNRPLGDLKSLTSPGQRWFEARGRTAL